MNSRHSSLVARRSSMIIITIGFFCLFLSFASPLQSQQNLAQQDYQSYNATRYASSNWNSLVRAGIYAFHEGQFEVAQKSLYKAFNMGCESPIVLFMLALINEYKRAFYSSLEYYQMAQKGFKRVNKNHRFNKSFLENYGRAMYYSGKKKEALPILKKAAKRSKSFWLLKLLGQLSYEQGDTLNAVSYFERAVRVRDKDVTKKELVYIYGLLGRLFLAKSEQDGAMRYYQKVLELDPQNQEAQRFLKEIERAYQEQKMIKMMDILKEM